jgi:hypothetical protein
VATGRLYQGSVTVALGILPPSGRLYQASADVITLPAPPSGRLYMASAVTAAGGVGTGRLYVASATAAGDPSAPPSGLKAFRGGNFSAITTRAHRGGEL